MNFINDKYNQYNMEIIDYIVKNKKLIAKESGLLIYK